jgi:hypothetical protein
MLVDALLGLTKSFFSTQVKDNRRSNTSYAVGDMLQAALAMFHLKDSSLLEFRQNMEERKENLERLYQIGSLPVDSAMRNALDLVDWADLQPLFGKLWDVLRAKADVKARYVLGKYLAFAADGTGHFASSTRRNAHSMVKVRTKNGVAYESYYHQTLAAVQVTPSQSAVFPMAVEPIMNTDGSDKNDCEQNALKRLLPKVRALMPNELLLGIYDALAANGPSILAFKEAKISFIITMKEGYVLYLVDKLKEKKSPLLRTISWISGTNTCTATYTEGLMLNGTNPNIRVNYVEYVEVNTETGVLGYKNAWITDLALTLEQLQEFVAVARSRWKIENETFNTLKNQGYNLEHNYGVGNHYLATNFMILTFIAFFIDQIAFYLDLHFLAAYNMAKSYKKLWEKTRQLIDLTIPYSFDAIYRTIAKIAAFDKPIIT